MVRLDDTALDASLRGGARFVYKHSPTCWLSARAWKQVEAFCAEHPEVPVHWIDVLDQRPLSQDVAARLGIPHASPQVILVRDGEVLWDTSHLGVTQSAMERALGR